MDISSIWTRYQQYRITTSELGLELDVSHMGFGSDFFNQHSQRVASAILNMQQLEAGEAVNKSENRMVGHYWLRAPELAPSPEVRAAIESNQKKITLFAEQVLDGAILTPTNNKFKYLLVIGIGGSALGPQLIYDALAPVASSAGLQTFFFDNTDLEGMALTLARIPNLEETLVLVVSKSGGTPETFNGQQFAWKKFLSLGLEPHKHFVAVTGAGSKLDLLAQEQAWLARFPMWDWVGGRTSIWGSVGLLPAALQGIDITELLAGAAVMDTVTRNTSFQENPALMLALMWGYASDWKGEKVMVVLPYKDRLRLFASYLQQLIMESLGKSHDSTGKLVNQGLSVFGNKGSTDQHSYVQQLRDGVKNFFAVFVNVLADSEVNVSKEVAEVEPGVTIGDYLHSFLIGTRTALYESGRESLSINVQHLTARSLGGLLAMFERAVSFYAAMVDINAYDQPGVEAGKKSAANVIDLQKRIIALDSAQLALDPSALAKLLGDKVDPYLVNEIVTYLRSNGRI